MPDPDPSTDIVVIVDKPCWEQPIAQWQALIQPVVLEALCHTQWIYPTEITILLTDDARIQQLNKSYRGQDKPTNVLAFPSLEPVEVANLYKTTEIKEPVILGDVALAWETIQQESLDQNKLFDHHLSHLVAHGVLHLLGWDHEKDEDAAAMESVEIKILASLNITNPYQE